jgi:hypothetical protein
MVNVLGVRCAADRALTSLSSENLLELHLSQLVPAFQVIVARAAVLFPAGTTPCVVTGLAIGAATLASIAISREIF